jgi:palmitoyltransferase ZDHHC13/17
MNLVFFVIAAAYNAHSKLGSADNTLDKMTTVISTFSFACGIFFYFLVMINPGYVPKQKNFLGLLERLLEEKFFLDYVCIYCENLRPENSAHCNFCDRCVEKFDHHCNFVNNCLGYRNHKYFLTFLVFFSMYMISLFMHAIYSYVAFAGNADDC